MTSNDIIAASERQAQIEAAKVAFFNRGGRVKIGPGVPDRPVPAPRSAWVDPETVLKRRRRLPTPAERAVLRRMADSL
ncbi:hypothetical protein ASF84_05190 [Pseudomonas sp. Leaf127]|uniref:hypothetical protein n=1 Tax=Pseudomonas sp. Leaf127 TaxID=1736267 RepID=UPI0007037C72|nr:hypothetical protein [Pseudomonas sp. Leaf127]KQQ60107.1 hypothetical protein ASF84_05190 [Pseudomonas sp. Leaf127]